jgi:acetyl-CoA synthetase
MFEGVPNYPTRARFWDVIDKHKVNIFYTAPTAIRALMGAGDDFVKRSSRVAAPARLGRRADQSGSLGMVLPRRRRRALPDRRYLVADGDRRHHDHAAAGRHRLKPGSATRPFFGIKPALVDDKGKVLEGATDGNLVHHRFSWPGQMRTVYGDHERFVRPISPPTRACISPATAAAAMRTATTGSPAASMT